tara:strand:+ start:2694 stop:3113 length:420 start_codon:yes stop_codon:yes gene_type:complete
MNLNRIISDLYNDEGFRSSAYQDTEGYWTIGIGTLIDERRGGGITQEEAEYLAKNRVMKVVFELDRRIPWYRDKPSQVQEALVNMAYQMGAEGLMMFRNMLACIKNDDFDGAYREALDSRWARQTPNRAKRVAEQIRTA